MARLSYYKSSITFFIAILFCTSIYSQKHTADSLAFYKAQEKINNSISGYLAYKLNYLAIDVDLDFHCYAKQYFIKNNDKIIAFYVMQYEDNGIYEYAYYNDTLLTYAYISNSILTKKQYSLNPITGNTNDFRNLIIERKLNNFLSFDKVTCYDTILSDKQVIIGEAFTTKVDEYGSVKNHSKITLDKNDLSLLHYKNKFEFFFMGEFSDMISEEYIIDSISLFSEKNVDIEQIIKKKYSKLNRSIVINNINRQKLNSNTASAY